MSTGQLVAGGLHDLDPQHVHAISLVVSLDDAVWPSVPAQAAAAGNRRRSWLPLLGFCLSSASALHRFYGAKSLCSIEKTELDAYGRS